MATKKSNKSSKSSNKPKASNSKPAERTDEKPVVEAKKSDRRCLSGFFARKYEGRESISTIFKDHKFYGALLGEIIGTALITLLMLSLAIMNANYNIAVYSIILLAILAGIYAFSGACLNPIVTAGMMATRRISLIRGVMYIIGEVIGAWIAWLILSGLHAMGGDAAAYEMPAMAAIGEGGFWPVALIEMIGSFIVAFFFSRAVEQKRSVFTFAAIAAGGTAFAFLITYVISAAFFGLQNNSIFNPAVALMMQIFPQTGDNFGQVLGGICQALSAYAILPMIAGVVGFYLSDFTRMLSEK